MKFTCHSLQIWLYSYQNRKHFILFNLYSNLNMFIFAWSLHLNIHLYIYTTILDLVTCPCTIVVCPQTLVSLVSGTVNYVSLYMAQFIFSLLSMSRFICIHIYINIKQYAQFDECDGVYVCIRELIDYKRLIILSIPLSLMSV